MQAPHFFEESGHSHAFAEGNLHMKGVLMKYAPPFAPTFEHDTSLIPWYPRGQGDAKAVLKKFPEGECDHFKLTELLAAADVTLNDLSTLPLTHFFFLFRSLTADCQAMRPDRRESRSERAVLFCTPTSRIFTHHCVMLPLPRCCVTLGVGGMDGRYNNIRCDGKLKCAFGQGDISYRYRIYRVPESNVRLAITPHDTRFSTFLALIVLSWSGCTTSRRWWRCRSSTTPIECEA